MLEIQVIKIGVQGPAGPPGTGEGAGVTDGNKGSITVSASGMTWTINGLAVTNDMLAGSIAISKISGLQAALDLKAALASPAFTGTPTAPTASVSTNTTQIATCAFVQAAVAALVDASPGTLDTLNELAGALGDDPNFATTVATSLGLKAPLASPTFTGTATFAATTTAGAIIHATGTTWSYGTALAAAHRLAMGAVGSDITGISGATVIYNVIGITKAGYAALVLAEAVDTNTYYIFTDGSMGDYGAPVLGEWTADTGSTADTPAAGELRWNNATQTSATALYLDGITAGAVDMNALLLLSGNADKLLVQSGAANYQLWQLSAAPSLSSGNWTFPVTLLSSAGTGTTGFADGAALIVAMRPAGERRLITDYLSPAALTSSAGIAWDVNSTTQPTLTLAHNTTITLSNLGDGQSASLSGIMGGSGSYTVALAHSGLTVRVMGGALADIAALAANDLFEISVKRSGTDLRVWVNTLEI